MNDIDSKYDDNLLRTNHFEIELSELSLKDDSAIEYKDIKYYTKCIKFTSSDKFIKYTSSDKLVLTTYATPQTFNILNRISKCNPDFNVKITIYSNDGTSKFTFENIYRCTSFYPTELNDCSNLLTINFEFTLITSL